jgi:UDP-N-acetylglucosamine 2-epimerase (non-hydrolysing)
MKLAIVVGTRPEIIKLAPVIRACVVRQVPFTVIHTGQHYSFELDGVFFAQLALPAPRHNLNVGSGSHGFQISAILAAIEPVLAAERPDQVLVEGDTNSVLAAGLAANKLRLRVGHVEAGLRSDDRTMPEEINRILVDHLAEDLFAPTPQAVAILHREGIAPARVHLTGNTVVDEVRYQRGRVDPDPVRAMFGVQPGRYALATVHRAENVGDPGRLRGIFAGLDRVATALDVPVLVALHPRTAQRLAELEIGVSPQVRRLPPLGYHEFLALHAQASLMLTDSGGLQEEACTLGVPCVTLRDNTERPESIAVGANRLVGADPDRILEGATAMHTVPRTWVNPFGDGHAGERIVDLILARDGAAERRAVALPVADSAATSPTAPVVSPR